MNLNYPVTNINFIGEKYQKKLKRLDIETVEDLLRHYPSRYKDYSQTVKIADLIAGEKATILAEVLEIKNIFTRRGKKLTKALVRDESGTLLLVWFNQHYLTNTLKEGNWFYFSGKLKQFSGQPAFLGPEYESAGKQAAAGKTRPDKSGRLGNAAARKIQAGKLTSRQSDKPTPRHSEFNSESDGRGRQIPEPSSGQALNQVQGDAPIHTARLVPIYPETKGVSSKWLRARISSALKYFSHTELSDPLPKKIRAKFNLPHFQKALKTIHFPKSHEEAKKARKRFAFEEMFQFQLRVLERQREWERNQTACQLASLSASQKKEKLNNLTDSLPFELTEAQETCVNEILTDIEKDKPMNRLLQGDVGSGKTVVAVIAAYVTALNGYQTAYMAPTEILAQQVYRTFRQYLKPFDVSLSLQTGSSQHSANSNQPSAGNGKQNAERRTPMADIIIGTHALLHRTEIFDKLALVIIDEQHRFGVKQRAKLLKPGGEGGTAAGKTRPDKSGRLGNAAGSSTIPHTLTMTATPIPRSMALTTYGHLDISTIDEMPPGIRPTKTWLVPEKKREAGYRWIKNQLDSPTARQLSVKKRSAESGTRKADLTNQAFIICPLIEESDHETLEDVKAVTTEFERLKKIFSEFQLGLLHGRIKNEEKEKTLQKFRRGETQILVSTPVVEVGIDIPQANIMVIEGAHRFGLASLHQLRGRVGRAGQESFCLLFTPKKSKETRKRLKALEQYNSGLRLAELDLKIRGPGELYGTKQHGVPEFKLASLSDIDLIKAARAAAGEIITELKDYPELKKRLETEIIAPN